MLSITMQLDISARLTLQVTTINDHYIKNILLKKRKYKKNMGRLYQNSYVNKNDTYTYL